MTSRERVTAALNFERPDRLQVTDALWDMACNKSRSHLS